MTLENLPGLQAVESVAVETDIDMCRQVAETQSDTVPDDSATGAATAEPAVTARPCRRRLGDEEPSPAIPPQDWAPDTSLDPERAQRAIAGLRSEQSLARGLAGGAIAAVAGAILWAAITVAAEVQIGWMAIGVAAMVGGTVRVLGKGITKPFGYVGATLSLLGCLGGNLLSICVIIGQQRELPLLYVLTHLNPAAIPQLMAVTFHPMDLLFYGLALYAGYRCAFRQVSMADVVRVAPS